MNYQEKIKAIDAKASKEAREIVAVTMRIEAPKRWQEEHKGLTLAIIKEISREVMEIVK